MPAEPKASFHYQPGEVGAVFEFLKRTRNELRMLRKVRVYTDRIHIVDVNGDYFEVRGLGYPGADVVPVLENVGANFKPERIHEPADAEYKEFLTGRRYPWAQDRVM